jgi:hypothetical protein
MSQSLTKPVDEVDQWLEDLLADKDESPKLDWLPEHDYTEGDGQPDVEEDGALKDTLKFYLEDDHGSQDDDFEFQFRAYLHNGDYSYSAGSIRRLMSKLLERRKTHG